MHIAFDTGFDPNGLAEMFQLFEQMSPSSRSSWDLMTRTHPFSIDRINAVREYAALLPARPLVTTSPAFKEMKARLAVLPPAPDATGLMKAPEAPRAGRPPAATPSPTGRIAFTIESPAYGGEMPEGWVARRTDDVVIIEGAPGTEPYAMTIRLVFYDKAQNTLDDLASGVREVLAKLPDAAVTVTTLTAASEGRPARALVADYTGKDSSNRPGPFHQVIAIVEYADHLIVLGYSGPSSLHDKYAAAFEMVGSTLRERR